MSWVVSNHHCLWLFLVFLCGIGIPQMNMVFSVKFGSVGRDPESQRGIEVSLDFLE